MTNAAPHRIHIYNTFIQDSSRWCWYLFVFGTENALYFISNEHWSTRAIHFTIPKLVWFSYCCFLFVEEQRSVIVFVAILLHWWILMCCPVCCQILLAISWISHILWLANLRNREKPNTRQEKQTMRNLINANNLHKAFNKIYRQINKQTYIHTYIHALKRWISRAIDRFEWLGLLFCRFWSSYTLDMLFYFSDSSFYHHTVSR